MHCFKKRDGGGWGRRGGGGWGGTMSLAGGEVATVAPWHNFPHRVHRLCSSWRGVAGHVLAFKRLIITSSFSRNNVQSRDFKTTHARANSSKSGAARETSAGVYVICLRGQMLLATCLTKFLQSCAFHCINCKMKHLVIWVINELMVKTMKITNKKTNLLRCLDVFLSLAQSKLYHKAAATDH